MCASFYLVSTRMYLEMRDFKTNLNQKSPELEFRLGNGPEFHPLWNVLREAASFPQERKRNAVHFRGTSQGNVIWEHDECPGLKIF